MEKYEDLIYRIVEIIKYSEGEIKKYSQDEIAESFSDIAGFKILNECTQEFRDLLSSEMVFHKMLTTQDVSRKNDKLLRQCQEKAKASNENTDKYLELIGILNSAYGGTPLTLKEFLGYYVLKADLPNFINLCRDLQIGVGERIKDLGADNTKAAIYQVIEDNREQTRRIRNAILQVEPEVVTQAESVSPSSNNLPEDKKIFPNKNDVQEKESQYPFKAFIYLGLNGDLTLKMVTELQDILSHEDFDLLLDELLKYSIFSETEIKKLRSNTSLVVRDIKNIDEFIAYFAFRDGLNMDVLKQVVLKTFGYYDYHYFIDKMFEFGKISYDEFMESVQELMNHNRKQ